MLRPNRKLFPGIRPLSALEVYVCVFCVKERPSHFLYMFKVCQTKLPLRAIGKKFSVLNLNPLAKFVHFSCSSSSSIFIGSVCLSVWNKITSRALRIAASLGTNIISLYFLAKKILFDSYHIQVQEKTKTHYKFNLLPYLRCSNSNDIIKHTHGVI